MVSASPIPCAVSRRDGILRKHERARHGHRRLRGAWFAAAVGRCRNRAQAWIHAIGYNSWLLCGLRCALLEDGDEVVPRSKLFEGAFRMRQMAFTRGRHQGQSRDLSPPTLSGRMPKRHSVFGLASAQGWCQRGPHSYTRELTPRGDDVEAGGETWARGVYAGGACVCMREDEKPGRNGWRRGERYSAKAERAGGFRGVGPSRTLLKTIGRRRRRRRRKVYSRLTQ
jgi:hypothetical protein